MKKGLGSVTITKNGHDELSELYYHTWIITSGTRQFMFHGAMTSLRDAVETVQELTRNPYKPKAKKVN